MAEADCHNKRLKFNVEGAKKESDWHPEEVSGGDVAMPCAFEGQAAHLAHHRAALEQKMRLQLAQFRA